MDLPLAPVERILKRTHMRVSDEATVEFAKFLEEIISDIAAEAVVNSRRAGRKTVSGSDVRLAKRKLL